MSCSPDGLAWSDDAAGTGVTVPDPAGVSPRDRSDGPVMVFHSSLALYGSEAKVAMKSRKKLRHGALRDGAVGQFLANASAFGYQTYWEGRE